VAFAFFSVIPKEDVLLSANPDFFNTLDLAIPSSPSSVKDSSVISSTHLRPDEALGGPQSFPRFRTHENQPNHTASRVHA
jgi:hypothetical protein